jgi:5-formyltetrahydrofolate cyclo-ligase
VFATGIGWDAQVSDARLPGDPWDVPLDAIATPREWVACR